MSKHLIAIAMLVLLTGVVLAQATTKPFVPVDLTVGSKKIRVMLPPGSGPLSKAPSGVAAYGSQMGDKSGKIQLKLITQLVATDRNVPKNDADIRAALGRMAVGTRLPLTPEKIHFRTLTNVNKTFDIVDSGLYSFGSKNGHVLIVAFGMLISKSRDIVVPISIMGDVVSGSKDEVARASRYMAGVMHNLCGTATLTR